MCESGIAWCFWPVCTVIQDLCGWVFGLLLWTFETQREHSLLSEQINQPGLCLWHNFFCLCRVILYEKLLFRPTQNCPPYAGLHSFKCYFTIRFLPLWGLMGVIPLQWNMWYGPISGTACYQKNGFLESVSLASYKLFGSCVWWTLVPFWNLYSTWEYNINVADEQKGSHVEELACVFDWHAYIWECLSEWPCRVSVFQSWINFKKS